MIIFNQLKRLSAVEGRVDTSSDTFYNRGYGTPSADCRIEERAGVLGKLTFTAGGFADDFEYSGHPLCDPPSGGVDRLGGRNLSLIFFFPPFFFYLFIYLYRVSPRWGEALGRNKMSFFQEKIFLTKKNIFRPGANALLNTIQVEPGALRAPGRGPPAELSRLTVFREAQQVRNSRYEILENKAWRVVE